MLPPPPQRDLDKYTKGFNENQISGDRASCRASVRTCRIAWVFWSLESRSSKSAQRYPSPSSLEDTTVRVTYSMEVGFTIDFSIATKKKSSSCARHNKWYSCEMWSCYTYMSISSSSAPLGTWHLRYPCTRYHTTHNVAVVEYTW